MAFSVVTDVCSTSHGEHRLFRHRGDLGATTSGQRESAETRHLATDGETGSQSLPVNGGGGE